MDFDSGVADAVKGFDYVSLDVFDTILVRPYLNPDDLFRHMESMEDAPGFAEARLEAERKCMETPHSTTLDAIYDRLPERYRHLKEAELEYELQSVCPRRIRETYERIASEHKVVLISDMYLPSEFISRVLEKNGITGYERLYISCENGASKGRGDLFDVVIDDLRIDRSRMIHIGDHPRSDYLNPKARGIKAILTQKPKNSYFSRRSAAKRYYRRRPCLERSIIVGMDVIREFQGEDQSFWRDVAYRFGGPIVSDYCNFIFRNMRKDDALMMVARDGYNIRKVMKILHPEKESFYIYAPRILNVLIGSNYAQHSNYKKRIVTEFYGPMDDPDAYYDQHEDEIRIKRKEAFDTYFSAITTETGVPKGITAVDVTTMKYTSQKLLNDLFPDSDVLGLYYFLLQEDPDMPHRAYHVRNRWIKIADNINLTEFFMSSPEPPITGIDPDGRPRFQEPCGCEKERLDIYDDVTRGEMDYAADVSKVFGDRIPLLGFKNITDWVKVLTRGSGGKVREELASMKWAVDMNHTRYVSVIFHPRDAWFHLLTMVKDILWFASTRIHR